MLRKLRATMLLIIATIAIRSLTSVGRPLVSLTRSADPFA